MPTPSIETAAAVFTALAILAIFVERALATLFESKLWVKYIDPRWAWAKEVICLALCYKVCVLLGWDAVSMVAGHPDVHTAGLWITAATMAGGSKGSKKLFYDFLDIKSNAARDAQLAKANGTTPP
jgi:hypothetical protein